MLVIVGLVVVFGSMLLGYTMHHGHVVVLLQWSEFMIIGGAAIGAFLVSNPMSVVKGSVKGVLGLLKPNPYNEKAYAELLQVLYDVFQKARKDGLVGLEAAHRRSARRATIFKKYPFFCHHHHALPFLCDTLKVLLTGAVEDHHLAEILDLDLERQHEEARPFRGAGQGRRRDARLRHRRRGARRRHHDGLDRRHRVRRSARRSPRRSSERSSAFLLSYGMVEPARQRDRRRACAPSTTT